MAVDFSSFENWAESLTFALRPILYLHEWELIIRFDDKTKKESGAIIQAYVHVYSSYLQATIHLSKHLRELFEKNKYEHCTRVLLHELCHILTQPPKDFAIMRIKKRDTEHLLDVNELQTSRLTNILFDLLPRELYTPAVPFVIVESSK